VTDVQAERPATCRITHRFRYSYTGPVANVNQRLVVVPPRQLGPQRLRSASVEVSLDHTMRWHRDEQGNTVAEIRVPRVEESVEFVSTVEVERDNSADALLPTEAFDDPRWRRSTRLTTATEVMERTARELTARTTSTEAAAEAIAQFVHRTIAYCHEATEVDTTAAEALKIGAGVCQDHAHLMVAMCRSIDVPARYISGHLRGEGATHAWVDVLDPTTEGTRAIAFDPCNDRRPNGNYITVAVGRDYRDVAPTSGTYEGPHKGWLTAAKTVEVFD
jgi:transglutaminase-like putative cysteine protease